MKGNKMNEQTRKLLSEEVTMEMKKHKSDFQGIRIYAAEYVFYKALRDGRIELDKTTAKQEIRSL